MRNLAPLSSKTTGFTSKGLDRLRLAIGYEPTVEEAFAKLVARFGEAAQLERTELRTTSRTFVTYHAYGDEVLPGCMGDTPDQAVTRAIEAADAERGRRIDRSTSQVDDAAHEGGVLGRITRAANGADVEAFEE